MTRKIVGSIISGGKLFVAGQEDAFAQRMQGRSVQHLVDSGKLEGDWSDAANEKPAKATKPSKKED